MKKHGLRRRARVLLCGGVLSAGLLLTGGVNPQRVEASPELGVDVSSWQGSNIDWQFAATSGISFAYIRAGEGAGALDTDFRANWYRATAANVRPGAYLFFHPAEDPMAQAELLLSQLRSVNFTQGDLLPAIDVEVTDGLSGPAIAANLAVAVNTLASATGAYPVIYTAPSWWDGHVGSSSFIADPLWVANWGVSSPSVPAFDWGGNGWQVWQYSNAGAVPGIPGSVDLDQSGAGALPFWGSAGLVPQGQRLPAANVAGTPQTVSDVAGDVDVVWRGTDSRLWTIGYRNDRWAAQATPISAANVGSDPAVVSAASGTIDVFWAGTDGHLWHVAYRGSGYGTGSWDQPASLGGGPLDSAPHAVATGDGAVDVFWKGPGGSLQAEHFGNPSYATTVLGAGALAGDPYPVATGSGAVDVFWRDASANLWLDQLMSWGWGKPVALGDGPLASDPVPASAGGGNADVFWRGSSGALWHLSLSGSVASVAEAVDVQPTLGRPTVVEPAPGSITLVLQRSDGNLATVLGLPGIGWVGPELLDDGPVGSDPSAVAYAGGSVGVYWRGQDGGLWSSPACPGCAPALPPAAVPLP